MTDVRNRVIDTCVMLDIWHGRTPSKIRVRSKKTARSAAKKWLESHPNDVILTPIRLELIGGSRDADELQLTLLFLDEFEVLDRGRILDEDWRAAERYARWIRGNGRSRGALDSLMLAVCDRLNADFFTHDTGA